jgi:radical SAM superfamily enzyme YgiQ (UPF0313 family)
MSPRNSIEPGGQARKRRRHPRSLTDKPAQVLYIHPSKQGLGFHADPSMGRPYGLIPLGLPAAINLLRKNGFKVHGVNHPLEMQLDPHFDLAKWLRDQDTARVILIDMHWYEHCYGAIDIVKLCKEVLPSAWTVLGGLSASGFASEILEKFPEVDFIIRGDGEKPLVELVRYLLPAGDELDNERLAALPNLSYRVGEVVKHNIVIYSAATEDLDALDFVDISFLDHAREYYVHEYIVTDIEVARLALQSSPYTGRWICTARGCRFHCSYCGGSKKSHQVLAGRNGVVVRSPEKVVEDLVRLKQLEVIQASLSYDIAQLGEDYWQELFDRYRTSGVKIGLYNEFFQLPSKGFCKAFARTVDKAHSAVAMSALSGSERVRRLNGKHYSNAQLFDILDVLARDEIYLFVYFSLNLPGEDRQTFQETLNLAQEIYDFYPTSLLKILNTAHTIDPFSPMNWSPEKYGIISTMSSFKEYYIYCYETQYTDSTARTENQRGFRFTEGEARSVEDMANKWDWARVGRENSWWPVPPSW